MTRDPYPLSDLLDLLEGIEERGYRTPYERVKLYRFYQCRPGFRRVLRKFGVGIGRGPAAAPRRKLAS